MRLLPARRAVAGRRPEPRPARRERAPIPWARLGGAAGLVATSALLYWMTNDRTFAVDAASVPVTGARFSDAGRILDAMGLTPGSRPSIFRLRSRSMEAAAEQLPTVRRAEVVATLPDHVTVTVIERAPMVAWHTTLRSFLVDVEGVLFAPTSDATAAELGTGDTGSALPAITDDRPGDSSLTIGDRLDPLDLSAVRLIGALTPADLLSDASSMQLAVDLVDGWVLTAPGRWRAVFGHYTPQLRPPDVIPQQVQCLRSLLAEREASLAQVTLALSADPCGTYLTDARAAARPRRGTNEAAAGPSSGAKTDRPSATRRPAGATADPGRRPGRAAATPRPAPRRTPRP
jgi:hypothetical protein